MKHSHILAILFFALLASCGRGQQTFTLEGTISDKDMASMMESATIYLKSQSRGPAIDSAVITDGKFTFSGDADIHKKYALFTMQGGRALMSFFIPEGGTVTADLAVPYSAKGTPLNEQLSWLYNNTLELIPKSQTDYAEIRERKNKGIITEEEFQAEVKQMFQDMNKAIRENAFKSFGNNMHNAVGYSAISILAPVLNEQEIDSLMQEAGDEAYSFPELRKFSASDK